MIVVAGATGHLGSEVCRGLVREGHEVRAMVRATSPSETVRRLEGIGASLVEGDLKEPASLERACRGATGVVTTVTTTRSRGEGDSIRTVDRDGQIALVDAAREAGVEHFVYVSYSGNISTDDPLTRAKRAVEDHLMDSGFPRHTILRPSYFMEAWLTPELGFDYPKGQVTIYGTGENPVSWISLQNVADFAVESFTNPAAHDAVLELGGPEPLSPLEVVDVFREVSGISFDVRHVPEEELEARREDADSELDEAFAALMLTCARGDAIDMTETAERFEVEPISVRDYAEDVLGRRRWA